MNKDKHIGSSLDSLLEEDGLLEQVEKEAMKKLYAITPTDKVRAALERACIWDVEGAEYYREALSELDGKVIVPVEPTEAQIDRVFPHSDNADFNDIRYEVRENYRAMIAAYVKGGMPQ